MWGLGHLDQSYLRRRIWRCGGHVIVPDVVVVHGAAVHPDEPAGNRQGPVAQRTASSRTILRQAGCPISLVQTVIPTCIWPSLDFHYIPNFFIDVHYLNFLISTYSLNSQL